MQAVQLVKAQRVLAGLQEGTAPALKPVPGRALALDLEAGTAVGEQQEACGAGDQVPARAADRIGGLLCEATREDTFQRLRPADDGAVAFRAKQVVAHAMVLRKSRFAGEMLLRVEGVGGRDGLRVLDIERAAGQELVEEPGAAG